MRKEPIAALWLETHSMFWPMDPGTAVGTQDNVPGPMGAGTWRAKKGLQEVMTSRIWPNPGLSHKAKTRENTFC